MKSGQYSLANLEYDNLLLLMNFSSGCICVFNMTKYRRKFILKDGRKVYASKWGEIDLVSQETVDNPTGFAGAAFTHDPRQLSTIPLMESENKPYVRIIAQVFEPDSSPVDLSAYVAGTRLS